MADLEVNSTEWKGICASLILQTLLWVGTRIVFSFFFSTSNVFLASAVWASYLFLNLLFIWLSAFPLGLQNNLIEVDLFFFSD